MHRSSPDIPDKFSTFANNNETDQNDNSSKPQTDYEGQVSTDSGGTDTAHASCETKRRLVNPKKARIKSQDRKNIEMLVVASYNRSDWTYGWISILEGFSIYVNSELEETLDNGMTLCKQFLPMLILVTIF